MKAFLVPDEKCEHVASYLRACGMHGKAMDIMQVGATEAVSKFEIRNFAGGYSKLIEIIKHHMAGNISDEVMNHMEIDGFDEGPIKDVVVYRATVFFLKAKP